MKNQPRGAEATAFIARWQGRAGSERANAQLFVTELCGLLGVPPPDASHADTRDNAYVFERRITFAHGDGSLELRHAKSALRRFIGTPDTSKHQLWVMRVAPRLGVGNVPGTAAAGR